REVLGDAGACVEPGDTSAMAAACVRFLTDPELAASAGEAGRRRAEAFDAALMGGRHEAPFHPACRAAPPPAAGAPRGAPTPPRGAGGGGGGAGAGPPPRPPPRGGGGPPAAPSRSASSRSERTETRALARPPGSSGATSRPEPSETSSGRPPVSVTTRGRA